MEVIKDKQYMGLTDVEVQKRISEGKVNKVPNAPTRTLWQIIRANLFNRFNAINIVLAVIVIIAGSPKNAIFAFVIITNTLIGVFQELRAKETLEKLSILNQSKVKVIRNGDQTEIDIEEIVLDDILVLNTGDQISADAICMGTLEYEVDESLLTGESDAIHKKNGSNLYSGSFVIAGHGLAKVTKVGADTYTSKLSEEAKKFKKLNSKIGEAVDTILKYIMYLVVPISILLVVTQIYFSQKTWQEACLGAVAGIIGMIPEGLVLLTSLTFVAGVIRLSKWNTLVQELPATEVLARVNVLCVDKTGTLTEGILKVVDVISINNEKEKEVLKALGEFAKSTEDNNATQQALLQRFNDAKKKEVINSVPFSSARKWSALSIKGEGAFYFGAPEMVLKDRYVEVKERVEDAAKEGKRVLVFCKTNDERVLNDVPKDLEILALILIQDIIRKEAPKTLEYFKKQGVDIKVISGDNPITVSAIAKEAGVFNAEECIDARTLSDDPEELSKALEKNTVFGRVNPHQKKEFVKALQAKGKVVAMTGDGVNDVLALKESDCGIAMANGSEATKAVAQLVLLDSNFSALPEVVAEGRRMINNVERVSVMFLSKTVYSILLSIIFVFLLLPFPLLPIQLSLIGSIAIGIPSFFLALVPNTGRVKPEFLRRVFFESSVPNGIVMCISTTGMFLFAYFNGLPVAQCRTIAVIVLGGISLLLLFTIAKPFDSFKLTLVAGMFAVFSVIFMFGLTRNLFNLELISIHYLIISVIVVFINLPIAGLIRKWLIGFIRNYKEKRQTKKVM